MSNDENIMPIQHVAPVIGITVAAIFSGLMFYLLSPDSVFEEIIIRQFIWFFSLIGWCAGLVFGQKKSLYGGGLFDFDENDTGKYLMYFISILAGIIICAVLLGKDNTICQFFTLSIILFMSVAIISEIAWNNPWKLVRGLY